MVTPKKNKNPAKRIILSKNQKIDLKISKKSAPQKKFHPPKKLFQKIIFSQFQFRLKT